MSEDDIRRLFAAEHEVSVQVAADGDGSPEMARGDTFVFAKNADGSLQRMPFATITTKDYPGFDTESDLDQRERFRLNLNLGNEMFEEVFGFSPKALDRFRSSFDPAEPDVLFPHPVYGSHGWLCVVSPGARTADHVRRLAAFAMRRALRRATD